MPGPAPSPPENLVGWRANPKYRGSNGYKTPKPKKGSPPMPPDLTEAVRDTWLRILPILEASRVITVADADVLFQYCVAYVLWRECADTVLEEGFGKPTVKGDRVIQTPASQMYPKLSMDVQRLSDKLGLNPSGRASLQVTTTEEPADDESAKKQEAMKKSFGGMVPGEG